jgi:hypothetical protein
MNMKLICQSLMVIFLLLSAGCAKPQPPQQTGDLPPLPKVTSSLLDPKGVFTLFISNQSFAVDPVDVHVEIDGEIVVRDYFRVGTQHTFVPFQMNLTQGKHKIKIWSERGKAELTQEFDLRDQDIGVVEFWYYPDSHYDPTPRSFSFSTRKGPLLID